MRNHLTADLRQARRELALPGDRVRARSRSPGTAHEADGTFVRFARRKLSPLPQAKMSGIPTESCVQSRGSDMFKRISIFTYGARVLRGVLRDLPVRPRIRRQLPRAALDRGAPRADFVTSALMDLGLLLAFAAPTQRHGAARVQALVHAFHPRIGRTQHLRAALEPRIDRAVPFWQPLGGTYGASESAAGAPSCTRFRFGWALVLVSTFLINHFDLFGLRQVWLQLRRQAVHAAQVRHAGAVQARAPSAVSRLVLRVLGDARR